MAPGGKLVAIAAAGLLAAVLLVGGCKGKEPEVAAASGSGSVATAAAAAVTAPDEAARAGRALDQNVRHGP